MKWTIAGSALALVLLWPPGFSEPAEPDIGTGTRRPGEVPEQLFSTVGAALGSYELQDLDLERISEAAESKGRVTLEVYGARYELEVKPSGLLAPGVEPILQTPEGPLMGAPVLAAAYRGTVAGRPDSDVRLVLGQRILAGHVRLGEDWIFLEPLWAWGESYATGHTVVYRGEDVVPPAGLRCGVAASKTGLRRSSPAARELARIQTRAVVGELMTAVEADGELFDRYGPDSHAYLLALLNATQGLLERELGVSLVINGLTVHSSPTADPYTAATAADLLEDVRRASSGSSRTDLALLLTGRPIEGGLSGAGEVPGACGEERLAAAVVAVGQSSLGTRVDLVAHQIAHALATDHDTDRPFEPGLCAGDGPVMCAELQADGTRRFSDRSKADVTAHLEARRACSADNKLGGRTGASARLTGSITVTEPDGVADRVAEGRDYATYELGDPWDMNESTDLVTDWTSGIANEAFVGGIYGGTTGSDPNLYLVFPGIRSSVNLEKGADHPIDSSVYRYLSARVRFTAGASQPFQVFFFEDDSFTPGSLGYSVFKYVPPNQWRIIQFDLAIEADATSPRTWISMPQVRGLRIDPGDAAGIPFEIDWIRLAAEPTATPAQKTIAWTANGLGGATFAIDAIDTAGAVYPLATGLAAGSTSHISDFSRLAPGDYTVRVSASSGESDSGAGPVSINQAPLFGFTQPDRAGDEANDYATAELGNPWGPFDPADVASTTGITNLSYSNPPGTVSGDTTGEDPRITLSGPVPIDSAKYRVLSYKFELDGPRDIGLGSVSRVLWGTDPPPNPSPSFTSDDILVQEGVNTYFPGDMTRLPLEGGVTNQWNGNITVFRFDPHEFPTSRHFTLHWVKLAPYDNAAPSFTFEWMDADPDDDASIELWLDVDRNPTNGNEQQLAAGLSEDSATDSLMWNGSGYALGLYEVFARVTDSLNTIDRYATGPLLLEPATGPVLGVFPGALDFGGSSPGVPVIRELTLSNVNLGPDAVVVSSTTVSDTTNFAVAPGGAAPCASLTPTIASQGSCTLEATFNPGTLGRFNANLAVVSNSAIDPTNVVSLTGGGCSTTADRVFSNEIVTGPGFETREACHSIAVGPAFEIGPAGNLSLRAGHLIRLDSGFEVSGSFVAEIDPALAEN